MTQELQKQVISLKQQLQNMTTFRANNEQPVRNVLFFGQSLYSIVPPARTFNGVVTQSGHEHYYFLFIKTLCAVILINAHPIYI